MKRFFVAFLLALFIAPVSPVVADSIPRNLAGFVLGGDIADFESQLKMGTAIPVRHAETIKEVEIQPFPGLKNGLIAYGTCDKAGKILRIKLKYNDSSKAFFQELLKRYKRQLGEPKEWKGDPFHVLLAWKWSYKAKNGDSISLILQHNAHNEEEKMGNAVKLTNVTQIVKESNCCKRAEAANRDAKMGKGNGKQKQPVDWKLLVPR